MEFSMHNRVCTNKKKKLNQYNIKNEQFIENVYEDFMIYTI